MGNPNPAQFSSQPDKIWRRQAKTQLIKTQNWLNPKLKKDEEEIGFTRSDLEERERRRAIADTGGTRILGVSEGDALLEPPVQGGPTDRQSRHDREHHQATSHAVPRSSRHRSVR